MIDLIPVDADVLVAVAAGVLVMETQSVHNLVLDDAKAHAAEPLQRHYLLVSCVTQQRRTPDGIHTGIICI